MMEHLIDALNEGTDIGHYGRFVFASIARHFLSEDELISLLERGDDGEEAKRLVHDINTRNYSPPRREKILSYQEKQDFLIIPNPDDPDSGNVYRDLTFPDAVYDHIAEYRHEKETANAA
ncbi:MAG: hypothetical protein H7Y38_17905 [Armatimonadetes bacterium]|nr:hypothetical protein [Armatimonadota bacterium]